MSDLKIFNTLTKKKEIFKSISPGKVGMYVCGVTVYDYCHIGHGRMFVNFDVIRRWLIHSGYEVNFVQNITDVDDKIIARSLESHKSIKSLTNYFIQALLEDVNQLNVIHPNHQPRASEYISAMCSTIYQLLKKNYAYQSKDGDINYAVRQFKSYGKLSGKCLDQLQAREDVVHREGKRDLLDFALWKKAKIGEPMDAIWDSPWGKGRPGWHIECSAMSNALLGDQFDIHGGGQDLQFPHHENEIAQSEAANNGKFVNYWMHNGHIKINDEKMSKSVGNFVILRDLLNRYDGEVIRFYLITAHYRSPLEFNEESILKAKSSLTRLYLAVKKGDLSKETANENYYLDDQEKSQSYRKLFHMAMNDDFNTPKALSVLFMLTNDIFRRASRSLVDCLVELANILGILYRDPDNFLKGEQNKNCAIIDPQAIEALIAKRAYAKSIKDFNTADAIRKELLEKNIVLEDTPNKTTWRKI